MWHGPPKEGVYCKLSNGATCVAWHLPEVKLTETKNDGRWKSEVLVSTSKFTWYTRTHITGQNRDRYNTSTVLIPRHNRFHSDLTLKMTDLD